MRSPSSEREKLKEKYLFSSSQDTTHQCRVCECVRCLNGCVRVWFGSVWFGNGMVRRIRNRVGYYNYRCRCCTYTLAPNHRHKFQFYSVVGAFSRIHAKQLVPPNEHQKNTNASTTDEKRQEKSGTKKLREMNTERQHSEIRAFLS